MSDVNWLRVTTYVGSVVAVWALAGRLKRTGWAREGDARKLNHIVALAGGAALFGWLPRDVARASYPIAGVILFALLLLICQLRDRVPFSLLFYGYARSSDA